MTNDDRYELAVSGPAQVSKDSWCMTVRAEGRIVASMSWQTAFIGFYIDFLFVEHGSEAAFVKMLAWFRKKYRGEPISFNATDDNVEMQRLVKLLGAEPMGRAYLVQL